MVMEHLLTATLLNIILTFVTRLLQRSSPYVINTKALDNYDKPYHSFKCIRFLFSLVLLSNSVLIADDFHYRGILLYTIYWVPVVMWWEEFYKKNFKRALFLGLVSAKTGVLMAMLFKPHPLFWTGAVLWSGYISFLAGWYQYCLPT